jgi:DNA-binding NtrC family response regulator
MSGNAVTTILVVDDSADTAEIIQRNLTAAGFTVFTADSVDRAVRLLADTAVDLVITDFKMPGQTGLDLVRHVRENFKHTEVMMITGYPSISGAVAAVKLGAEEYLAKPFTDEELLAAVQRSLAKLSDGRDPPQAAPELHGAGLIGASPAMEKVRTLIAKAAAAEAHVLITGDSGTGKELVARAIHYNGRRAAAPFVPINCAGIPENLLESELFGHVKGAFTGASQTRAGFFQVADGGTIFLDEIGELSKAMQVKLLRVLQDKNVVMVGDTRARRIDARILAATNKDLEAMTRQGAFREDLYFRLNVVTIQMPPLRDRPGDVRPLVDHFLKRYGADLGRPTPHFTDRALTRLETYHWPGNVRELENLVQRLLVMTEGDAINAPDLPAPMRWSAGGSASGQRTLAQVEADHIRHVLESVGGNKSEAARVLNIDRKTLREKIKKYALPDSSN